MRLDFSLTHTHMKMHLNMVTLTHMHVHCTRTCAYAHMHTLMQGRPGKGAKAGRKAKRQAGRHKTSRQRHTVL